MKTAEYRLGVDLGAASLGWALVEVDKSGEPKQLLRAGVRIFDPGVEGTELSIQQGKDESKNVKRRQMRLQRRQLRRRAARQRDLFELLQAHQLLPAYPRPILGDVPHVTNAQKSAARHEILTAQDQQLHETWKARLADLPAGDHVLPYFLRAVALREKLEPYELGRALYHLGQRRGFLSNRKQTAKTKEAEEDLGKVKEGISELQQEMQTAHAPTLAAYWAATDPREKRIRGRWTARAMFEEEFERIWTAQAPHHAGVLPDTLKARVRHLLFFQRPIAKQAHLVGMCELERERKRAPLASLAAQRFRLLQKVNDLRAFINFQERAISPDERKSLAVALEQEGDKTFEQVRKLLGLPKGTGFNLARGGEKKIPGNRTAHRMRAAFGERWEQFSVQQQNSIVDDWSNAETEGWLVRRGMQKWGLDESAAKAWAETPPEGGYARLSLQAFNKLLPKMEEGLSFKEAETSLYGHRFSGGKVYDLLPPVNEVLSLRNPAVERALTELRKVVNAIIREHGKPADIHIELARDLKRSREDRKEMWKQNRERQGSRERLAAEITKKTGMPRPSRWDIERALLWEECNGTCPYTGKAIPFASLFSGDAQFDIEHILPFSRCPDDSFANKTLCHLEENRNRKRNQTPWEAYGGTEQWDAIIARVERFKNPGKMKRFLVKTQDELGEFTSRQLNDTRYSSKEATRYVGLLYGGRDERGDNEKSKQRVFASPGGLTAILRRNWGLEEILREAAPSANGESKGKPRTDHRHHAIDAIVIALSSLAAVKALAGAAERNAARGRTTFKGTEAPWPNFVDSIRPHIGDLVVSHRPERTMNGQLHDETLYGMPYQEGGKTWVHVRKPVSTLTSSEIEEIADPAVQKAVQKRAAELGDLKKIEGGVAPPLLRNRKGNAIPIRRVRIRKSLANTLPVGNDIRRRYVAPNNNHHMEIVAELDESEREVRWEGIPISLFEARRRQTHGEPVVQRNHGTRQRFVFSLMKKDTIEVNRNGEKQIMIVKSVWSSGQLTLAPISDARLDTDMRKHQATWFPRMDTLRTGRAMKVQVDLLGKVHRAND